jgi:Flp pilus assembly pilin Flp
MSVEYALMLVVITGAIAGVLGLGVTGSFKTAQCALQSAITDQGCGTGTGAPADTGTPSGVGQPAGTGPTGEPTTGAPLPADPPSWCETTSSTSGTATTTAQTETSDSDTSASGCPTSTN